MSDKEHTLEYLQKFYEEHRDWQADVVTLTLSLHDLIVKETPNRGVFRRRKTRPA